jgi:hypothetical protein
MKRMFSSAKPLNFKLKCLIINSVFAILSACGSTKNVVCSWQNQPLLASGIEKDWGEVMQFDPKTKFGYKLSNDSQNFYIMLKIDDEALKRKVLVNGLKVFIDTTNHKKEKFGIHFPIKRTFTPEAMSAYREKPDGNRENSGRNADRMKEQLLEELQVIELIGFHNRKSNMLMIGESKIKPVIMFDQYNAIIYQLVLPLGYVCKHITPNKMISFGFIAGNSDKPEFGGGEGAPEGRLQGGGMRGGGMRGGGYAGREGGSGYGRSEKMGRMSEPSELWVKNYCLMCKK